MGELSKLPNIGKAVEEQLNKVGIDTSEKLRSAIHFLGTTFTST